MSIFQAESLVFSNKETICFGSLLLDVEYMNNIKYLTTFEFKDQSN